MDSRIPVQQQLPPGRWIWANAALASLFVIGLLAIAFMGGSGIRYEAAVKSAVSTAANTHPKAQPPSMEITGSIGSARATPRGMQ